MFVSTRVYKYYFIFKKGYLLHFINMQMRYTCWYINKKILTG